ncbi:MULTISPECIES: efflux RND transporter periplasmic adaptor subunit [unclassified Fusibacter]|uniref:efflux RND transporter periplasmic adaptor subunit n=1 Tax=unclassified Fusibacter TaxID=2624464 RepID=UPI0010112B0B|nr:MULTISPECIES: efflux RND transporter periplasmic adaptor subunit [unclassified Fusibacter]MCK8058719.1 efflux RND transporter periplasmic adaptor subunit [Fusibacter sp. A2]NPE21793.1 efflux RND transporter periplasmic adaptor subunit [Fusibacter sp. A1]RXV61366.1 efflux RND transporter periplasmic adaptor subunit [Fusibacter sp. A1]
MKTKLIIAFVALAAIGGGIFYFLTTGNIGEKYNTVEVKRTEVEKYVQDTGRISSENIRRYFGSGLMRVEEMTLTLGASVKKGELLVKYEDSLDLEMQKVEKQMEALSAAYDEAVSGTASESVSSASVEVARIKNLIETATKTKQRTEALYNSGVASLAELEQVVNNVEQLQSSLKIAQNTYNQLAKGVSKNIRERYEAELEVLHLTLESLQNRREDYVIYADVDGIVTELNTFVGDIPAPGIMIIEIQDPTEKVVLVDFMVEDAINIRPDAKAVVKDLNLGLDIGDLKVDFVYPKAFVTLSELGVRENRQTVEIDLPESAANLAFGLEVETLVITEETRVLLMVPVGAVFTESSKQYVNVLEDGDLVEREIKTGIEVDGNIEVIVGLEEGELVLQNYQED